MDLIVRLVSLVSYFSRLCAFFFFLRGYLPLLEHDITPLFSSYSLVFFPYFLQQFSSQRSSLFITTACFLCDTFVYRTGIPNNHLLV